MASSTTYSLRPIGWLDNQVRLLDQTLLPSDEVWLKISDYREVIRAIKEMKIRGAPAIGIAGAYAVALSAVEIVSGSNIDFMGRLEKAAQEIREARPTGANLAWAVKRMLDAARRAGSIGDPVAYLVAEAERIHDEDEAANRRMGKFGSELIPPRSAVLTHCNTGALATGGLGTALGVIRTAWDDEKITKVYATETRPLFQGARLTAWELTKANIDATVITDSSAGNLMRAGKADVVIVGADRIAANGDVANKIGTYTLAVLARENGIPFYVAAPTSTIDMSLASGDLIPIEQRPSEEVACYGGTRVMPVGMDVLNTAFDVTPHRYVTAIITEMGVFSKPYAEGLKRTLEEANGG